MAASKNNKSAAARASGGKKVSARGSSRSTLPAGTAMGLGGRLNSRLGSGAPPTSAPAYETPGAMGAVTPIAAPPVVTDPFLTPTDLANQALELASVDQYLSGVDANVTNARADAAQKTAAIDTAEGRNLESADWNTAARGLGQSSIRDTTKAQLSADASSARGATKTNLGNAENYAAGEHQRADTVIRPAIGSKYNEFAKRNAQDTTDAAGAPADGAPADNSAVTPSGGVTKGAGTIRSAPAVEPGAPTQQEQFTPVVKNGKFYHYYPSTNTYVFIRNAS